MRNAWCAKPKWWLRCSTARGKSSQLHFGGGTPNFLSAELLAQLVDSFGKYFHLSASAERDFSIELDPRFLREGDIAAYAGMGINRASLGVQDFDAAVQQAINREQSVEQTLGTIEACRRAGFRSVNVDLIYGLPRQTRAGFGRTLDTMLEVRPDRVAIYGYAHMPELFKAQKQIVAAELPDAAQRVALLSLAVEKLTAAGYQHIGLDHFALPDDELACARMPAACIAISWVTPHTPTAISSAWVSAPSAMWATASARTIAISRTGKSRWTRATCRCGAASSSMTMTSFVPTSSSRSCAAATSTCAASHSATTSSSTTTSPHALRQLVPLMQDGLVDVDPCAYRRDLAWPAAAAYHRDVFRSLPAAHLPTERPRHSRVV